MKRVLVFFLALIFLFLSIKPVFEKSNGDYVVILHGIARNSNNMQNLANFLEIRGYDTINLDYPSTKYGLKQLAKIMNDELKIKLSENKPVHFVSHSMGGLLIRAYLNQYRPNNLGRVVMLAPPNQGSEIADFLKENQLYQAYYGPAGKQLITDQTNIKDLLGEVDYELGIIAGNRSIDPVSSLIIPQSDDGKVSIKSTKLKGMSDHIVINATHTFIARNKQAQQQIIYFLENGAFKKTNIEE